MESVLDARKMLVEGSWLKPGKLNVGNGEPERETGMRT